MVPLQDAQASIRRVLRDHGRLHADPEALPTEADLYQCGMTWDASINVMLALEAEFEVEFPDRMLKDKAFRSIGSIERALRELIAA